MSFLESIFNENEIAPPLVLLTNCFKMVQQNQSVSLSNENHLIKVRKDKFGYLMHLKEKDNEILYLQSELESVVTEKSSLKTRLYQLEQDLNNLRTEKSQIETENFENIQKLRILETELENLKRFQEEATKEKENKTKETTNVILRKISKLKAHLIKCKEDLNFIN